MVFRPISESWNYIGNHSGYIMCIDYSIEGHLIIVVPDWADDVIIDEIYNRLNPLTDKLIDIKVINMYTYNIIKPRR